MWLYAVFLLTVLQCFAAADDSEVVWKWTCEDNKCVKSFYDPAAGKSALSLNACKMFCNEGVLWPKPTGESNLGNYLSKVNINNIVFKTTSRGLSDDLVQAAQLRFKNLVSLAIPKGVTPRLVGKIVEIYLDNRNPDVREFSLDLDESYSVKVLPISSERIHANVTANTFFGLRHGLETLAQLFVYDDIKNLFLLARDAHVADKPRYSYRGILLDTSRNYFSVDSIKRTIDAMAAVKLNTFHWHITDSHSFPFVSSRRPQLSRLGAYSASKVYTSEMIQDVVQYALERGVRVLPEFDAPAHVGEGWQGTNLTVCFKADPWKKFCVEPPCGQLNPTREELYDYLEDIYTDMAEIFKPDMFHMGGDEVSERCWNSSEEIQNFMVQNRWTGQSSSFLKLWNYFQQKAQDKAYKAFGKKLPLIIWTSTLTEFNHIDKYLSNDDYIIQVWTTGSDPQIKGLLEKGYRLIISNYDALYFDCGFGAWIGSGNNWCSPYIGWQKVYDNSPAKMAVGHEDLILGAEAALWSEQADEVILDSRLWPRAAALAERLWADPDQGWQDAEQRLLHVRDRLVNLGLQADTIEPEWCYQNEGHCY